MTSTLSDEANSYWFEEFFYLLENFMLQNNPTKFWLLIRVLENFRRTLTRNYPQIFIFPLSTNSFLHHGHVFVIFLQTLFFFSFSTSRQSISILSVIKYFFPQIFAFFCYFTARNIDVLNWQPTSTNDRLRLKHALQHRTWKWKMREAKKMSEVQSGAGELAQFWELFFQLICPRVLRHIEMI